jgi:hypothetical protein
MSNDVMHTALATWAAKDIPARLQAGQVAKLLNCSTDDVAILASSGKLRALGRPRPNAVKYFNSIELITLLANPDWLDEVTRTISQYWQRKNARRRSLPGEPPADEVNSRVESSRGSAMARPQTSANR